MMKTVLMSLYGIVLSVATIAKENNISVPSQKMHFLENKGQIKDQSGKARKDIDFSLSSGGVNIYIGDGALHYQFSKLEGKSGSEDAAKQMALPAAQKAFIHRLDVELVGANRQAIVETEGRQSFITRYYEVEDVKAGGHIQGGNGIEAYSYNKLTYKNVYPNIDWVIYIKDDKLEHDFVVRLGGDPNVIRLKYTGATQLSLTANGSLTATTPLGSIEEHKPYSFQADGREIASSYKVDGDVVSFNVGRYEGVLTIDPSVVWSSFFGGSAEDQYWDITTDAQGDVYAAGRTHSSTNIATNGTTYQAVNNGPQGFISKFDSDGNLLWATYWSGTFSAIHSIAIDGLNNIYVAGNFEVYGAVGKFSTSGAFVSAETWGNNTGMVFGYAIACDNNNNVYFGARTDLASGIPTVNAYQPTKSGYVDCYFIKLNPSMVIQWATYYGKPGDDLLRDIGVDAQGNLYVMGETLSDTGMVTVGPIVYNTTGEYNIFLAKFNQNGQRVWGAMFGSPANDFGGHMVLDDVSPGAIYLSGYTYGSSDIATPGAYQTQFAGQNDGYLARYDTSGVKTWVTYVGGNGVDGCGGMAMDETGVYIAGGTSSSDINAINGFQSVFAGGDADGYIVKFSKNGDFIWSSYFGGNLHENLVACAINPNGDLFVIGNTRSDGFLTNPTHQSFNAGGLWDGYIAKINKCMQLPDWQIDGPTGLCLGSSADYLVPSSGWVSNPYAWSLAGGLSGTSTSDMISVSGTGVGNATVSVSANNGCDTISESLNIIVHPLPVPTITNNGNQLSTGTFVTYQWNFNGTPITGATNQDHTASADGDYSVTVTDANGCESTSGISPVGVAILDGRAASLIIAPNPSDGDFVISGYLPSTNTKADMVIVDVTGSVIYRTQFKVVNNQVYHSIRLEESVSSGTYYIKLTSDATSQVIRFVKR